MNQGFRHAARTAEGPRPRHVAFTVFAALVLFNVALPKGGISLGGVPLTFGYALLGIATIPALLGLFLTPPRAPALMQLALGFLPLALLTLHKIFTYPSGSVELVINGTLFLLLPTIMLLTMAPWLEKLTEQEIGTVLKWAIRFAVAWGLLNFFLFAVAHRFIEIPYLTVNAGDLGEIYDKNNRRGSLMKLVSSYNNGNVYGAVMIMLAPVYIFFERSARWRALFLLSILLTLSRTAWFGLIAMFMVMAAMRLIRLGRPTLWMLIGLGVTLVSTLLPFMGWTRSALMDSDLGGRMGQIEGLEVTAFGGTRVHIPEIVYAGLLQSFGVIGMVFALVALGFPLLYGLHAWPRLSALRRHALAGCVCYLLVAMSDGAFILAPVLVIYLMLCALVYRRGYAPARDRPRPVMPRPPAGFASAN